MKLNKKHYWTLAILGTITVVTPIIVVTSINAQKKEVKFTFSEAEIETVSKFINSNNKLTINIPEDGKEISLGSNNRTRLVIKLPTDKKLDVIKSLNELNDYIFQAFKDRLSSHIFEKQHKEIHEKISKLKKENFNVEQMSFVLDKDQEIKTQEEMFKEFIKLQKNEWDNKGSVKQFEKYNNLKFKIKLLDKTLEFKTKFVVQSDKILNIGEEKFDLHKKNNGEHIQTLWIDGKKAAEGTLTDYELFMAFNNPFGVMEDTYNDYLAFLKDNKLPTQFKITDYENFKEILKQETEKLNDKSKTSDRILIEGFDKKFSVEANKPFTSSQTGATWEGEVTFDKNSKLNIVFVYSK